VTGGWASGYGHFACLAGRCLPGCGADARIPPHTTFGGRSCEARAEAIDVWILHNIGAQIPGYLNIGEASDRPIDAAFLRSGNRGAAGRCENSTESLGLE
jgi:hypothetical protein